MSCSYREKTRGGRKRSYVSGRIYSTSHDDDLFDSQERLWVFSCGNGKIGQWSDSDNGDCVWFVLCEYFQHHLISRLQRWCEEGMLLLDLFQSSSFFVRQVLWMG